MLRLSGFVERVGDHVTGPILSVRPDTSCGEAVQEMRAAGVSHALVTAGDGRILGIVTEQDVVRRVTFRMDFDQPVSRIMTAPVNTIREGEFLYLAIARMRRLGLRHLPVIGASGAALGMIELAAALSVAAAQTVEQIDNLAHEDSIAGMHKTKAAQALLARELLADAVPAPDVLALISEINADLHRRVVELLLKRALDDGLGEPPVPFELIIMGSGGRWESSLHPDQDNGFVIDEYPDSEHASVDGWFLQFAGQLVEALNEVGFPRCKGQVMATNPVWRKRLSEWRTQVSLWLGKSSGLVLRLCDIFFDFRSVYGGGALSRDLRGHVTRLAPNRFFLREMYRLDEVHGPALGLFGRLKTDPLKGPGQGRVNLKLTGTLPLVGAVRILSLRERVDEISTLARIDALHQRGVLDDDEADYLRGGFKHITRLVLRQQLEDFEAGRDVGNHVPLEAMTRRDRDMLVDTFQAVRRLRSRIRSELGADVF